MLIKCQPKYATSVLLLNFNYVIATRLVRSKNNYDAVSYLIVFETEENEYKIVFNTESKRDAALDKILQAYGTNQVLDLTNL